MFRLSSVTQIALAAVTVLARLSYLRMRRVLTDLSDGLCVARILTLNECFLLLPPGPEATKDAAAVRCVRFAGGVGRGRC